MDIAIGRLTFAWIIVPLDSSYDDLIIFLICHFLVIIYTQKCNYLFLTCTLFHLIMLSEYSIVGMVCLHPEAVLSAHSLKGYFSFCSFICHGYLIQMNVGKPRVLKNEYFRVLLLLFFQHPFCLVYKFRYFRYKLEYWYQLAWSYRWIRFFFVIFFLVIQLFCDALSYRHSP